MKKFLAVVLAIFFFLLSVIPASAFDAPYTPEEIVSNFYFNDLGEGKYSVPVDLFKDSDKIDRDSTVWKDFLQRYNSDEYTLCVVSSAGYTDRPYLYLFYVKDISSFSVSSTYESHSSHYDYYYYICSSESIPLLHLLYDIDLGLYLPESISQVSANSNLFLACRRVPSSCTSYRYSASGLLFGFYFFSPSFDNLYPSYIKFLDFNSLTFDDGHSDLHTLAVNYLYSENNPAADSITQEIAPGTEYSIPSPEIAGYTPSIPVVSGTMPDEDLTINVYYSKAFYPLTIKYQYTDMTAVSPDVTFQYPAGFVYDVPSPEIEGYQPDKLSVTGTMGEEPLEVVVTYSPIPYTLTVNYQYTDGSKAAESHQEQLFMGASYSVPSPAIEGFHPNQSAVTGVMPARDVTSTVTYREDSGGSGGSGGAGPDEGGGSGGEGGGGSSGNDPLTPVLPPYSGNDPFLISGVPGYSGYNPFIIPKMPDYSGYDPFVIRPPPAFDGYDPFRMPNDLGG